MTAGGTQTELPFWEATRRFLLTDPGLQETRQTPMFKDIVKAGCEALCASVRPKSGKGHDFGWFGKLESDTEDQALVRFREISSFLLPYSPNESYFGQVCGPVHVHVRVCCDSTFVSFFFHVRQCDYKMNQNAQVSILGLGAQTTAQCNRTFENIKLNKLALLVVRQFVYSKRGDVRSALRLAQDAADNRKLLLKELKVVTALNRQRAEHCAASHRVGCRATP